uniref:Uncharacterized protein n=1 Tax=Panagrolaimus superbus TaxID=310955 RepID=A0A914YWG0_9BILA
MLIELHTATLPWKGQLRREAGHLKETVNDSVLLKGCPASFSDMHNQLKKMTYFDTVPYESFRESIKKDMKDAKVKLTEPFEWEKEAKKKKANNRKDDDDIDRSEKKQRIKKADEQAEIEGGADTDTIKDLDDSVLTEGDDVESQTKGLAKEDTLDNVADMSKM